MDIYIMTPPDEPDWRQHQESLARLDESICRTQAAANALLTELDELGVTEAAASRSLIETLAAVRAAIDAIQGAL